MISTAYLAAADPSKARERVVVRPGTRTGGINLQLGDRDYRISLGDVPWQPVTGEQVLARLDGEPVVATSDGQVHVGFDWWRWERSTLLEESLPAQQPTYSKSRIPYTRIPFGARAQLNRLRIKALHLRNRDAYFPSAPVETALDDLRTVIWSAACDLAGQPLAAPVAKEVVLTHDLDEAYGMPGVELLRSVEREVGAASAYGVLSERYRIDEAILRELVNEGCEVFSHGYLHDGTLAFLPPAELRRRLSHFFEVYPSMREHVRGFRSGQLVRSAGMFEVVNELFDYDLTPPNVELGGPHGWRTGCATTTPYAEDNGLLHIPLTVPQDYFLAFIDRLPARRITEAWLEATKRVWAAGGVAVHLVHPDNVVRRPDLLVAYRDYLVQVRDLGGTFTLPRQLALRWPRASRTWA